METCFPGFHLENTRGEISIEKQGFPWKHQVFTRGKPGVYLVNTRKIPGQMPTFSMDSQNLKARPYDFGSRRKENTRFYQGFCRPATKHQVLTRVKPGFPIFPIRGNQRFPGSQNPGFYLVKSWSKPVFQVTRF